MYLVAAIVTIAASGCGKKGPPLAPLIRVPAAVDTIQARRLGNEVYVSLTAPPRTSIDDPGKRRMRRGVWLAPAVCRRPRSCGRVGTLIARVTVPPSPLPVTSGPRSAPTTPAAAVPGLKPGGSITVLDTLTEDEVVQGRVPEPIRASGVSRPVKLSRLPRRLRLPLRRFYVAYACRHASMPGPTTITPAEFVCIPCPIRRRSPGEPHGDRRVDSRGSRRVASIGFLLDRALPEEEPPIDFDAPEPSPTPAVPVVAACRDPRGIS